MAVSVMTTNLPHLTIRPGRGWAWPDLRELWRFRELLFILAGRDIKLRYKQTVLGAVWVVLQPLLGAGIFTFVFGLLAELPGSNFVSVFAGMFAWNAFAYVMNHSSNALLGNAHLIAKVYFPRLILPLYPVVSLGMDMTITATMLAAVIILSGTVVGPQILLLPMFLGLLVMLALGAGMYVASLMVNYRDVRHVLPMVIQFLLFASPVGYSVMALDDRVPEALQTVYMLNPLASLLEGVRWSVTGVGDVQWGFVAYSAVMAAAVFAAGAMLFRRMERRFADVI